jgi:hypothetical protein
MAVGLLGANCKTSGNIKKNKLKILSKNQLDQGIVHKS